MAIISSTAIGSGQKSAGVLTYRRSRGRTIASQRIVTNKSNTAYQQLVRQQFAAVSHILSVLAFWINNSCEKSRYGSARNHFYRKNVVAFGEADLSKLQAAAAESSPYNMVTRLLYCLTMSEFYASIGSGNGIVTPGTILGQQVLTGELTITAYNCTAEQCKAKVININADGTIGIDDVSTNITDDEGGVSCSLALTAAGSSTEINYQIPVFETPTGIVTSQYILAAAKPTDPSGEGGSPGGI